MYIYNANIVAATLSISGGDSASDEKSGGDKSRQFVTSAVE